MRQRLVDEHGFWVGTPGNADGMIVVDINAKIFSRLSVANVLGGPQQKCSICVEWKKKLFKINCVDILLIFIW